MRTNDPGLAGAGPASGIARAILKTRQFTRQGLGGLDPRVAPSWISLVPNGRAVSITTPSLEWSRRSEFGLAPRRISSQEYKWSFDYERNAATLRQRYVAGQPLLEQYSAVFIEISALGEWHSWDTSSTSSTRDPLVGVDTRHPFS